jgi:hypothetical protein
MRHPHLRPFPLLLALATGVSAQDLRVPLDAADATWHGAVAIADGAVGGAAHFDGDQARIDCGACAVDPAQPFTLRCRVRTGRGDFCTPLIARNGDAVGLSLVLGRAPGCISFEAWSWQTHKLVSASRVDDGKWHAIEVAYLPASTTALLYVDGRLEASASLGPGAAVLAQLRLGDNIGAHQPFLGDLDEVELLRTASHADDFLWATPVLQPAEQEQALAALRSKLLPKQTPGLAPDRLAGWPQRRLAVRAHVADCLGLSPEPPRGPLAVQVHGELARDGVRVQRVTWEGLPGTRASGWLWLPDPLPKGRVPAVLCPHGHWDDGAVDPVVQTRCIAFAKFGWICLGIDSVHVEDVAAGVSSIGVMTWNNIRALDLLCARSDVDAKRIGVTGASGGGQQTYYLMALDDRIAAAAPMVMACYFANIITDTDAHCACNHLPRLAAGTDVIEMCAVFAPRPALFGSVTGDWTHDFPEHGLPELRALWTHLGQDGWPKSRHANEGHNYDRPMREVVYGFLHDALLGPADGGAPRATFAEPALQTWPVAELRALGGPPHRAAPDAAVLAAEALHRRAAAGTEAQLAPALPWRVAAAPIQWRADASAPWRSAIATGADGVPVPFFVQHSDAGDDVPFTVVVDPAGKSVLLAHGAPLLAQAQKLVLVDPRWSGEWQRFAPFWRRNGLMLGCGEGYQAAHDLALVCASLPGNAKITLVGLGTAGVPALLAAPLCPRITRLVADDLGPDYHGNGNRLPLCPELLRFGDLARLLADARKSAVCDVGGFAGAPALTAGDVARLLAPAKH